MNREAFVSARVDYLNHLFASSPYLVSADRNPALAHLDILIPRVVLSIAGNPNTSAADLRAAVLASVNVQPLDFRLGPDLKCAPARPLSCTNEIRRRRPIFRRAAT